jgi:hypothetical protein
MSVANEDGIALFVILDFAKHDTILMINIEGVTLIRDKQLCCLYKPVYNTYDLVSVVWW